MFPPCLTALAPGVGSRLQLADDSAVTWPLGTTIGRVRITKSILRDRDTCVLCDLMAQTVHRNPKITAFHPRPNPGDYSSLVESLATCMPRAHSRFNTHYMAAHRWMLSPPPASNSPATSAKPATFKRDSTRTRSRGSCSSSIPGDLVKRPSPSIPFLVADNGSGTATALG